MAVRMDDSAPTHKRRKLVKTYKNVLPRKRTVVAEVSGETYSKKSDKKWSRKTATDVIRPTLKLKGNEEIERYIQLGRVHWSDGIFL